MFGRESSKLKLLEGQEGLEKSIEHSKQDMEDFQIVLDAHLRVRDRRQEGLLKTEKKLELDNLSIHEERQITEQCRIYTEMLEVANKEVMVSRKLLMSAKSDYESLIKLQKSYSTITDRLLQKIDSDNEEIN